MKFILKANIEFKAENIDDAFEKLSKHFWLLANDEDYEDALFSKGEIEIKQGNFND